MLSETHWMHRARMALFLHWGINTGNERWQEHVPLYKNVEELDAAMEKAEFSVTAWVDAAARIRADYVTLATFHSCLGYLKTWRSDLKGTPTTQRDILGELVEAAQARGIRVMVYITGDPASHHFFPDYPWIDDSFGMDLTDIQIWQRVYCKQVIEEIMDRYPQVAGFWFDGWNDEAACEEIFGFIHGKNPETVTIRNDFHARPFAQEDVMSLECFGKRFEPAYDYPSAAWVAPGGAECCYNISALSDWWYFYEPGTYDAQMERRRLASILLNGWVAHIGLGSDIAGRFPGAIGDFISDVESFFNESGEALMGVMPGQLPQGRMANGLYTLTAQAGDVHFVHCMAPPADGVVLIEDSGLLFGEVTLISSKKTLPFKQLNGRVRIELPKEESSTYPILRLEESGSLRLKTFEVAAHSSPLPCTHICDLGKVQRVGGLLLEEDECSSVTRGGWAAVENNRLRAWRAWGSLDGDAFWQLGEGEASGGRGWKQLNWAPQALRFLRLEFIDAQNTAGKYITKFENLGWTLQEVPREALEASGGSWQWGDGWIEGEGRRYRVKENVRKVVKGCAPFLLDAQGHVLGINLGAAEHADTYLIHNNACDIFVDKDGALYAEHAPQSGALHVRSITPLLEAP